MQAHVENERVHTGDCCFETKDQLDFHQAMQGLLKGWLFVHIPLTYALLLFALVHLVLVYAFSGARA